MFKKIIIIASSVIAISGCASNQYEKIPEANFKFDPHALKELSEASVETRDEMRLLAKTREAVAQKDMSVEQRKQRLEQAINVPKGFEKIGTVQYTGEAANATKLIAQLAGYSKVEEIGKKPRSPLIVSIDQIDNPLINGLRELGMQTGDKATVEVYPSSNLIRIKYKDTDQLSSSISNY